MLTQEQKEQIGKWVAGGMGLSDVQKKIKEDFGIAMLYMDVRLLVLEIGAQVKDKEEPKKIVPPPEQVPVGEEVTKKERIVSSNRCFTRNSGIWILEKRCV